jgi:hypothetical protein
LPLPDPLFFLLGFIWVDALRQQRLCSIARFSGLYQAMGTIVTDNEKLLFAVETILEPP